MDHGIRRITGREVYSLDQSVEAFRESFQRNVKSFVAILTLRNRNTRSAIRQGGRVRTRTRPSVRIANGTIKVEVNGPNTSSSNGTPRPRTSGNDRMNTPRTIHEIADEQTLLPRIFANLARNGNSRRQQNQSVPRSTTARNANNFHVSSFRIQC